MMKTQKQVLHRLSALRTLLEKPQGAARSVLGDSIDSHLARLITAVHQVEKQELLVPVIGSFSAGKSSLLNALLGSPLLPVAITPETALPAELRYSQDEFRGAPRLVLALLWRLQEAGDSTA